MLRVGGFLRCASRTSEKSSISEISANESVIYHSETEIKTFNDIKKLSAREVNELLIKHGIKVKNLRLEEKRIKLSQVLNVCVVGDRNIQDIISKAKGGWTKDIRKIPLVTIERVKEYLINSEREGINSENGNGVFEEFSDALLARYKTSRSYDLWASGNLHSFELNMLSESDHICLIRCKSNASWTSGKVYETTVVVDKVTAKPTGAYCLCVAGAGQACSHTAGLLFGLADFISQGMQTLPDGPATTEQLAYWINPKGSKVQPKFLHQLRIEKKLFHKAPRKKEIRAFEHDPRPHDDRNVNFNDYLELMASLRQCKPNAPILEIYQPSKFRPPNKQVFYTDHSMQVLPDLFHVSESQDPMIPSHEEDITTSATSISKQKLHTILPPSLLDICSMKDNVKDLKSSIRRSVQDIEILEKVTRGQATNQAWYNYRKGMITASVAHRVNTAVTALRDGKQHNVSNIVDTLMGKSSFSGNAATRYGQNHEKIAIQKFEQDMQRVHKNAKVTYPGMFVHSCGYLAASPDGVLQCDCCPKALIEVKCPISLMKENPINKFDKTQFLQKRNSNVELRNTHKYHTQVQMQMALTGIHCTHFIVWSPTDYFHQKVVFNPQFWDMLEKQLSAFFDNILGPACLGLPMNTQLDTPMSTNSMCGKCHLPLKDGAELISDDEASVQCDCKCSCAKWFHWRCVQYYPEDYEDLEDCEWFCPSCVQNCDIVY